MSSFKRIAKERNYTTMSNTHLRDINLSWKAKGVFSYLLSLPDDWEISLTEVKNHATDGRDSLAKAVNELETSGYITRMQRKNLGGHFNGVQFIVNEQPEPQAGSPDTVKPGPVNPEQLNTKQTNDLKNTNNISKDILKPVITDPMASIRKKVNTRKKPNVGKEAYDMISKFTKDGELSDQLKTYFGIRVVKGLKVPQWKVILDDLDKYSTTVSDMVAKVNSAIAGGYMQIIPTWEKLPNANKKTFDNTATSQSRRFKPGVDEVALDGEGNEIAF